MAYSKAKLKSSGGRASPCFIPFWIGKLSEKCLPIRNFYNGGMHPAAHVSIKYQDTYVRNKH
jgi:hypothetical protein